MKSNNSFIKKQKAEEKKKKRLAKLNKKHDKKKDPGAGSLENMIAYVDKYGNITNEPPEQTLNTTPRNIPKTPPINSNNNNK